MKKISLIKGNIRIEFAIDRIKYIIGNNYEYKYMIKQLFNEYFSSTKDSDYSINNTGKIKLLVNDLQPIKRETLYFSVNTNYSLSTDLKLTSKSLILKYLEILLNKEEYYDTLNTINILLEAFSSEIDDHIISTVFQTFSPKTLTKLITPLYLKEEEQANEYDMSYDEIILFQLRMINYIAKHSYMNNIFILLEIPYVSQSIKEYLNEIDHALVIIITNQHYGSIDLNDIYLVDDQLLDLFDENTIYEISTLYGIYRLEEAKMKFKEIIEEKNLELELSILRKL